MGKTFVSTNNVLTDMIFPNQQLPRISMYEDELSRYFAQGVNGICHDEAMKAIAARHAILDSYGNTYPFDDIITPSILAKNIHDGNVYTFFFVVDGNVAGTASVIPDHEGGAEFGRTAILRKYRRYGIGDLLLNARITFTSIYRRQLNIKWFYTSARSANIRIQDIWTRSPHHLKIAGLASYYMVKNQEFSTIFMRHFEEIEHTQRVECVQECRSLIEAVMSQFSNSHIQWSEGRQEVLNSPKDYEGYFTKRYVNSAHTELNTESSTPYCEILVPTTLKGSKYIQSELLKKDFIPTGFYPGFNGFPPFISFGRLQNSVLKVQEAVFPETILRTPMGEHLKKIYDTFKYRREIAPGDPCK